jgi:ABC-type multidrug transport system fused ATPase/permease subunit
MKMGLHSLRRNISVIPQTPFILNDNIRRNLDPFKRKSDKELWEVLEKVSLKEKILRTKEHLDTKISGS